MMKRWKRRFNYESNTRNSTWTYENYRKDAELERLRAMESERSKWEAERSRWESREECLVRQLENAECSQRWDWNTAEPRRMLSHVDTPTAVNLATNNSLEASESGAILSHGTGASVGPSMGMPGSTGSGQTPGQPHPSLDTACAAVVPPAALVGQQLPPLANFTDGEVEPIDDWLERFSLVASTYRWSPQFKMANLVMRLGGQAKAFYHTCPPTTRTNFDTLVKELKARFTPVRIQSVQTSLFHERKQQRSETVDHFAQVLMQKPIPHL